MWFELQRGQINQKVHSQRTARPCSSHIHDQQHQPHPPDQATNCVMHLGVLPVPQQKKTVFSQSIILVILLSLARMFLGFRSP